MTNPENLSSDANTPEEPATNRTGLPQGRSPKPSFSQCGHWVWMNRGLTDAGFRYYSAVRSYIFDADEEFEVDLNDEVIAELLDKSAKSIARARRDCYKAGVIEELSTWKESVRVEGKTKPEVRTFRRLIVHHEVPEGYEGPINAYDAKRRIEKRRHQEQKEARARRQATREAREQTDGSEETDLSPQNDQGFQADPSGPPAQCDRTDLSASGTNLSAFGTDLSATDGDDQVKQVPHLPPHVPPHQPIQKAAEAAGVVGGTERDGTTSTESAGSGSSKRSSTLPDTAGTRFLQTFTFQGHRFGKKAIGDLVEHVDALLTSGWTEQALTDAITDTTGVGTVKSPLGFVRQKLDGLAPKIANAVTDVQAQVDVLAGRGNAGAQTAAGLLGEFWDPEQHRTDEGAQDWIMVVRPQLAREYVEARRERLADALERASA